METHLASIGPSVPTRSASDARAEAARKTTQAWIDERATAMTAATAVAGAVRAPTNKRKPMQKLALVIVFVQALWAMLVPVKNIVTVFYPTIRPDAARTTVLAYEYAHEQPQVFAGRDLVPLLNDVLEVTLSNYAARKELEASGGFSIDRIFNLVSLDDFAILSRYYALVLQSSEFPGATFTPRTLLPASADAKLSLVLSSVDSLLTIDLACSKENAFLSAVRCTGGDGYPCPGDYPQENETRTFHDVDLRAFATNSGLENNVGLLYMLDFFQQAMSALFASRDWTTALEALNYEQSTEDALRTSSLSGFKDNLPILAEQDAFLVAVQASEMETTQLDSCVASELVVGQFYTRTFVLDLIQRALVKFDSFDAAATPIAVPTVTAAVMQPMFAFDLHITSGAQFGKLQTTETSFLEHIHAADLHTIAARVKFDHAFNSASQVAGSSMRMLQYMAFFPELTSVFVSESVRASDGVEYDVQTFKLIGATRSGVDTFKEPSTGANSWMVFPLAELGDAERPRDLWWDDEAAHAAWFQTQEADVRTAPFRVFDTHLKIRSATRVSPIDDKVETRCHRALFKVLGKMAYLALVEASKPASYLMFMTEVATEHRTWLLGNAFTEALVGDNFFGGRVAFAYRNGPYTRKDDGSAWVVIPLLNAMLEHFGADTTLAYILTELDRSFSSFVKAIDGNLQFPDAANCHIDGADPTTQTVTMGDTIDDIYASIYPGLAASIEDLFALVPTVHTHMHAAMATKQIAAVSLSRDQIMGTPVISTSTERLGASSDWHPTAFTAGMLKFWPPKTPLNTTVQQFRAATRCYRVLELRYLNTSTRCFAEPESVQLQRRVFASEAMRKFFLSNWTMAVMLNTMAWVIVLKYLEKLLKAWRVTQFECLDVEAALQLSLQGTGVLNISQSLLLLTATLPSLIGFHVPRDATFMLSYADEQLPKLVVDLCVTLSMSWFLKVGFEFCNNRITPRRPADWHQQFRLRWFLLMLIFIMRVITPQRSRDGEYLMWKLVITCLVALIFGACSTVAVFLPERRSKVTSSGHKENHDAVLAALVKQNLPLNRYGVLGRTSKGWSKTGLIVAGWKVARTENGEQVLRKGAGEILLPPEAREDSANASPESEVEGTFIGTTTLVSLKN